MNQTCDLNNERSDNSQSHENLSDERSDNSQSHENLSDERLDNSQSHENLSDERSDSNQSNENLSDERSDSSYSHENVQIDRTDSSQSNKNLSAQTDNSQSNKDLSTEKSDSSQFNQNVQDKKSDSSQSNKKFLAQQKINQAESKMNVILIWVNDDPYMKYSKEHKIMFKIFVSVQCFPTIKECQVFMVDQLESSNDKIHFLLMSGSFGDELVQLAQLQDCVHSVFIFPKQQIDEPKQSKVKLMTDNSNQLQQKFKEVYSQYQYSKQETQAAYLFNSDDAIREYLVIDFLYKLCIRFGNLYKKTSVEHFRKSALRYIKKNYEDQQQPQQEKKLEEIVQVLETKEEVGNFKMINCYTKESFFYPMLNNTLRSRDYIEIFLIRIAIYRLTWELQNYKNKEQVPKILYRGTVIKKQELESLLKNIPLMLLGFISTSSSEDQAKFFIKNNNEGLERLLIVVEMENVSNLSLLPISISKDSAKCKEKEFLFKINTLFKIIKIKKDEDKNLNIITLTIVDPSSFEGLRGNKFNQYQRKLNNILEDWTKNPLLIFALMLKELKQFKYTKIALKMFQSILKIHNLRNYKDYQSIADIYEYIGEIQGSMGDQNIAYQFKSLSLQIRLKIQFKILQMEKIYLRKVNPYTALSYNSIGAIYQEQGDWHEALKCFFLALEMQRQLSGESNSDVAIYYSNIGFIYSKMVLPIKALEYFGNALEIRKQCFGENSPDVASSLNNIGDLCRSIDQKFMALICYTKSLKISLKNFGEDSLHIASLYYNIGAIYQAQGDLTKALPFLSKSLEIQKINFGEDSLVLDSFYNNIGAIYQAQGDLTKALPFFSKSLGIRKKGLSEFSLDTVKAYNKIGVICKTMGNMQHALEYFQRFFQYGNNYSAKIALMLFYHIYLSLSMELRNQKEIQLEESLKYQLEVKEFFIKCLCFQYSHPSLYKLSEDLYLNMSQMLEAQRNLVTKMNYESQKKFYLTQALKCRRKSLEILKEVYGEDSLYLSSSYDQIGDIYQAMGNMTKALKFSEKSLNILKKNYGEDCLYLVSSYEKIGNIYKEIHNWTKALQFFLKCVEITIKNLNISQFPSVSKLIEDKQKDLKFQQKTLEIIEICDGEDSLQAASTKNKISALRLSLCKLLFQRAILEFPNHLQEIFLYLSNKND